MKHELDRKCGCFRQILWEGQIDGQLVTIRMHDHRNRQFVSGYEAVFGVSPAVRVEGKFPKNATRLVLQWIRLYREELLEDWALAEAGESLMKIPGLE